MRVLLISALAMMLGACSLIYKLPTRQGNVIDQKQLDQLKLGMTHQQVTYVMGTPIAANPFRSDRWDYFGYYKSPHGQVSSRTVSLYFDKDSLSRMDGINVAPDETAVATPDAGAIYRQQKKDKTDEERAQDNTQTGVVISTPNTLP